MRRFLFSCVLLSLFACGPAQGTKGGKCKKSTAADQLAGVVFSGNGDAFYKCDEGLTCNQSKEPFICEAIQAPGANCDRNEVCDSGFCVDKKCLASGTIPEGGSCLDAKKEPVFEACASDLFCSPENGNKCLPVQDVGAGCSQERNICKEGLVCGPDNKCAVKQ
jgi:hypothetical protein